MVSRAKALKIIFRTVIALLVLLGIGFVTYWVMLLSAFGLFDKTYNIKDLIETFNDKKVEIYEVKSYAKQIAPKFENFDVEFDDDGTINRLQIIPVDTGKGSDLTGASWYKDMGSKKLDSLLVGLGITENKLNVLKEKLKAAHCISVKSGEPTEIGFQRSGLGEYSFVVFDKPMSDSLKKQYSDSCLYRYVNSKLILEYGGGAVGPQCFPKR